MSFRMLSRTIDERFLQHRLRSTSLAGIIGGLLAVLPFMYRYYVGLVWSWDLFTVAAAIILVKKGTMSWYFLTD